MRLWAHVVGVTTAIAGIVLLTILPFLAGPYDALAVTVSWMCRAFGVVGVVLLAPVGAIWAASGYWNALARRQYGIAVAALVVTSLVWALCVVLVAGGASGSLLSLAAVVVWAGAVSRILPRLRLLKGPAPQPTSAAAFYLLLVPIAVAIAQRALVAPAIESSRDRAIRNSAALITDIERYRAAQGRYPPLLLSNVTDHYKPGVIGIEKYHYEPHEDAYNLIFEQPALHFGTREFVVYNPRDRQVVTVHLQDLLELTPEQLAIQRTRGHYAVSRRRAPALEVLLVRLRSPISPAEAAGCTPHPAAAEATA